MALNSDLGRVEHDLMAGWAVDLIDISKIMVCEARGAAGALRSTRHVGLDRVVVKEIEGVCWGSRPRWMSQLVLVAKVR